MGEDFWLSAESRRDHARECLELARTAEKEGARATLVQMAQVWARLADMEDEEDGKA
jgi:hypothetical protein